VEPAAAGAVAGTRPSESRRNLGRRACKQLPQVLQATDPPAALPPPSALTRCAGAARSNSASAASPPLSSYTTRNSSSCESPSSCCGAHITGLRGERPGAVWGARDRRLVRPGGPGVDSAHWESVAGAGSGVRVCARGRGRFHARWRGCDGRRRASECVQGCWVQAHLAVGACSSLHHTMREACRCCVQACTCM
jgi:hypothetical protein